MLRFVQNLKLSNKLNSSELTGVATQIYRQCFAELITSDDAGKSGEPPQLNVNTCEAQSSNQQVNCIAPTADDVWIFGYGSLVWKADFPYIDRRRGFICGYKRRFYQHSIDHRGVPEKPGRVVTLLPGDPQLDRVYGVAYRIAAEQKSQVLDHLDYREKNGYERFYLKFHEYPATRMPIKVIMYVASQANDSYAGNVWQVPCIARQIFTSAGPSGPNREYLFNLSIAMRELFPDVIDEHLIELVDCLQQYIQQDEPALLERALCTEITSILNAYLAENAESLEQLAQRLEELCARLKRPGWREMLLNRQLEAESS